MSTLKLSFEAIGTQWQITSTTKLSAAERTDVEMAVLQRIELFDKTYSRFRNDSLVSKLAREAGTFELPEDAFQLIKFYEQLYRVTEGQVTPLIGQVMSDAGYDAHYSLRESKLRQPPKWNDVIRYSEQHITMLQPSLLDFGAAGKGYLVDIISGVLETAGLQSYLINAGGDIKYRHADNDPISVGLENPLNAEEVVGVATIQNESICASAGHRRQWGRFTHIINPHTLISPQETLATWVIAADTMTADGLATALFFTDPTRLGRQFDFTFARLTDDMALEYAPDFPALIHMA